MGAKGCEGDVGCDEPWTRVARHTEPDPSCIVHRRETGLVCAGGLAFSIQRVFGSTFG